MFDIDEIMKRAQAASDRASQQLKENIEKGQKIAEEMYSRVEEAEAGQDPANQTRQVEIMGQTISPDETAAAMNMLDQLFGENMGVIAAALETLEMEDGGDRTELDPAMEEGLYGVLDEKLEQLEALPEPEPVPYAKEDPCWARFGILLSGIISQLNDHLLDGMDVEEHIPVMEQQIVSLVRRSWGINGRGELLDTIRYLIRDGYTLRYRMYCETGSPEDLLHETSDGEEQASILRGWKFAQHYKGKYTPEFLTGWDVGRAAMLTRWGCYLGWITEGEAAGILWELSQRAAEQLHDWREFAKSYLFGGLMWKLLCGDGDAESYLGFLADTATDLLTGNPEEGEGQWRDCPWPAGRKIGFHV